MSLSPYGGCCGITRRGFLVGVGAGLVTGVPLGWLGLRGLRALRRHSQVPPTFTGRSFEVAHPQYAMPGPFPGRVLEVRHPGAVDSHNVVSAEVVKLMMHCGMKELTGADHPAEAWRWFFQPGDVVGIKVNPVGMARPDRPEATAAISSPAVLLEVVAGLQSAGVRPRDIIVFERYAHEFRAAGYDKVMSERAMAGVRWFASGSQYDSTQLSIDGFGSRRQLRDRDPHVVGYDPDIFVAMGFASQDADPRDDRRFRSHLSLIVSRMVNKLVTIPVLKDHRSAGVTLALKNLSHGLNNNVARSHLSGYFRRDDARSDPNQCNTFIPTAAGQRPIREKATLHILDGLIGVYEGGPGCWNPTWSTWRRQSLFFATDPVAMDHVGWDIIDAKRAREGWLPVARMGNLFRRSTLTLSRRLAPLAARSPLDAADLAAGAHAFQDDQATEQFDRRQPEHIILAGTIGLGVFDPSRIHYRRIDLRA